MPQVYFILFGKNHDTKYFYEKTVKIMCKAA